MNRMLYWIAALLLTSSAALHGADLELGQVGPLRVVVSDPPRCGNQVDVYLHAPDAESYADVESINKAAALARDHIHGAGCKVMRSLRIFGLIGKEFAYRGGTSDYNEWVVEGGLSARYLQRTRPPVTPGLYGAAPGGKPASTYLATYRPLENPSPAPEICGPFVLRDPFSGSGAPITLESVFTRLGNGSLDTPISNSGGYRRILTNISEQRSAYDRRCIAGQLLERGEACSEDDFECAVVMACTQYQRPGVSEESRALFPSCINTSTRTVAQDRQRVLAALLSVEGEQVRFVIRKFPGADDQLGEWCGPTLYAELDYPQEFRPTPSLARTVSDVLNGSLSEQCPAAQTLAVRIRPYKQYSSTRNFGASYDFLQAYREGGRWNTEYHEDYLAQQAARARVGALFSMMKAMGSNPTELGYAMAMAPLNSAMADAQRARSAEYAREGNVCRMREAVRHCYVSTTYETGYGGSIGRTMLLTSTPRRFSSCAAPCEFHEGYCNMETGVRFGDAEAAERSNCRAASQEEIEAAIAAAAVDASYPPYPYELRYTAWDGFSD